MSVLSLDGGKNVGYAIFTDSGEDISRGVILNTVMFRKPWEGGLFNEEGGTLTFYGWDINTIVVESIRHNPMISQGGSQRWESQVEGAVRMMSALGLCKGAYQPPSILPVALMHEELEWPKTKTGKKKHMPDDLSAWLHGRYYLRSEGVLQ